MAFTARWQHFSDSAPPIFARKSDMTKILFAVVGGIKTILSPFPTIVFFSVPMNILFFSLALMDRLKHLFFPILIILLFSCNNESGYSYAIRDFRKSLQPHFIKIVSVGIVMHSDSVLQKMLTDNELLKLSQSEHPVLRSSAFREMLQRKSFNHFDIVMNHLNDTAIVAIDMGEFGIWHRTVSDDILQKAVWKTQEAKNKTIEQVLTKHNYLRSAYLILPEMAPQEKFYPFIKDMATRPRRLQDGYELDFEDIEYALYGLSTFKKKDDVIIIKNQMMQNVWKLSDVSFRLMKDFPDSIYLDVFQKYHYRQFYNFSGIRRGGFSGFIPDRADPEDFISALAVQQNSRSALLLDSLLNLLPLHTCMPDKENIIDAVIMAIWEHPCPAYARLRDKIKAKAEEILKWRFSVTVDRNNVPSDTTKEDIRW